jgi:transposase
MLKPTLDGRSGTLAPSEGRHIHAALSARINKTDRNDAMGIAQMMRVGLFKPVHVKTAITRLAT